MQQHHEVNLDQTIKNWLNWLHIFSREAFILLLFVAASAAVLNIFMQTRSLEEGSARFSLIHMLDGSAEQPFVKRQLLPLLANQLTELIPVNERASFVQYHLDKYHLKDTYFGRARHANLKQETWTADFAIKYHFIYALMFSGLLATLYLLRSIGETQLPANNPLTPVMPLGFALLLPLSFIHGGFFYDFSELFFFSALLLTAIKGMYLWWLVILPLAVLNKETAILAPLLFGPLLISGCRTWPQRTSVIAGFVLAGYVLWYLGLKYAANPGTGTEWHLTGNLEFWSHASNYFLWSDFYAPLILVPRGFNLLFIIALAGLIFANWNARPPILRQLFWVALFVNLPLFALFTYRDEIRNLSMLFIPTYLLAAHAFLATHTKFRSLP